ncbi:hypothetical protein DPMN_038803 [Dreissena polymorpha]|uniref:Uncharacterized protein n=1 Tax=Dreissena polymorpha TaxID=45954 RepID=A0A9D4RR15_DREPO|nr:hypothetical protein DPMN_038803 [Dreissena polymorpha]
MARLGAPGLVMGPCIVEIDRIVKRDVQYQLKVNRCKNEEDADSYHEEIVARTDGRTDGRTAEITTTVKRRKLVLRHEARLDLGARLFSGHARGSSTSRPSEEYLDGHCKRDFCIVVPNPLYGPTGRGNDHDP